MFKPEVHTTPNDLQLAIHRNKAAKNTWSLVTPLAKSDGRVG